MNNLEVLHSRYAQALFRYAKENNLHYEDYELEAERPQVRSSRATLSIGEDIDEPY